MKTVKNKHANSSLTPEQLAALVKAFQDGSQAAAEAICTAFRPLILAEAYKPYITAKLGEDAENIAWEIFLEFIHCYRDNKFTRLPGLIKTNLHYSLLHKVYPKTPVSVQTKISLDEIKANNNPSSNTLEMSADAINNYHSSEQLEYLLQKLTPKQRQVIEATIIGKQTLEEYRRENKISYKNAYIHQQKGLLALRLSIKQI